ncbi:MAG: hypothetical protein LIO58_02605 [Oscillospiraceae bacterium]|nr:hypothetical protein [Oscillospiraceae bacterium]
MKFWRRYWYYIGGILFVFMAFFMGLWGSAHLQRIQVILVFSWMGMLMHQFEEYALPGGFPSNSNFVQMDEK